MKTNIFSLLTLLFFSFWSINHTNAQAQTQSCEAFTSGIGNWQVLNAILGTTIGDNGSIALDVSDDEGSSWIYNLCHDNVIMNNGTISYSYNLLHDGDTWEVHDIPEQLHLITNTTNPTNGLYAVFVLDDAINENMGIQNITIPVHPILPGEDLPSNNLGEWQMTNESQWNTLLESFVAVAFYVDVHGEGAITENIHIDDFCYVADSDLNTDYTINTGCNGSEYYVTGLSVNQPGISYTWSLFETEEPGVTTGGTQVGTTQTTDDVYFGNLSASSYYYMEFTMSSCGGNFTALEVIPYHEIDSEFHFEDKEGKDSIFCYGEDVYLNGLASVGYEDYWIEVKKRPFPNNGTEPFFDYATYGWIDGEDVSILNLSDIFAEQDYFFESGYEYRVKLAVRNKPECVYWESESHSFYVECCENFLDGAFQLARNPVPNSSLYSLEASGHEIPNAEVEHTWHVLSSPNLNGGPYNLEATLTGDEFYYEVPEGQCYFVIHSLDTRCGEVCFGQSDCINAGFTPSGTCDLCGPIECELLDAVCEEPLNPRELCAGPNLWLGWDAVAGASSYVIEVSANDSNCCETELTPFTFETSTSNTYIPISYQIELPWDCIRWRVRADCGGEVTISNWSDYQCHANCRLSERAASASSDILSNTSVHPNPTNGLVQLEFEQAFTGELQLMDKLGRIIENQSVTEAESHFFDLSEQPGGLYLIVARSEKAIRTFKLMKE